MDYLIFMTHVNIYLCLQAQISGSLEIHSQVQHHTPPDSPMCKRSVTQQLDNTPGNIPTITLFTSQPGRVKH